MFRYLSEEVGPAFGVTFKLVYLDFTTTYKAVERREVDMVYTNPSVYACLEREHRASPVASLRNRRKVGDEFYELDHFYGTIFVKHNSPITKIEGVLHWLDPDPIFSDSMSPMLHHLFQKPLKVPDVGGVIDAMLFWGAIWPCKIHWQLRYLLLYDDLGHIAVLEALQICNSQQDPTHQ